MNDLAGRLNETPRCFSVCLCMVKDTANIFVQPVNLAGEVS